MEPASSAAVGEAAPGARRVRARRRVIVNVIGGSLGAGKTTAINHLLRHKAADERWAVLVNEYGEVGIDGALLQGSTAEAGPGGITVRELTGGCICCSAAYAFRVALVMLLQQVRPDRLIIEPTGLATLSGVRETLAYPGIREAVDLRTVITLVDLSRWGQPLASERAEQIWRDQLEAADLLLASRVDLAPPDVLRAFERDAPRGRRLGQVDHGAIPLELLDLVRARGEGGQLEPAGAASGPSLPFEPDEPAGPLAPEAFERRAHRGEDAITVGWRIGRDHRFSAAAFSRWVGRLRAGQRLLRLKALVATDEGSWIHNVTPAQHEVLPSPTHEGSRIELIFALPRDETAPASDPPHQHGPGHGHDHGQHRPLGDALDLGPLERGLRNCLRPDN